MLPPLPNGTILRDRYIISDVVGKGGVGSVYRAEDARLPGRQCAIKEVQIDAGATAEAAAQQHAQFLQEASILAQLDHPNLPKVSDFFSQDGREYLVMDYVPGNDLRELLDLAGDEALEQVTVLGWAHQILDALSYLHQNKPPVLHRDIKPSNIKLTPDDRIKLVDFGLAKLLLTDDMRTITVIQGRGTELYTPLEQYGGETDHTDIRSDLFALGATLYTLLLGAPPPSAKERFLRPHLLQPPHELDNRISRAVSDAIMWALEMHPDRRPNDSETMRAALLGEISPTTFDESQSEPEWIAALRMNRLSVLAVVLLFIMAIILTVIS